MTLKQTSVRCTRGFTLIELLVVIAIIAILAAILFPVFTKAKGQAKSASCQSNMKQMGIAVRMYMDEWNGYFPLDTHWSPFDVWLKGLEKYAKTPLLYRCPADSSINFAKPLPGWDVTRKTSYGTSFYMTPVSDSERETMPEDRSEWSHGFTKLSMVRRSTQTIYVCETAKNSITDHVHAAWWRYPNTDGTFIKHTDEVNIAAHESGSNYLFCDGHVELLRFEETWTTDGSVDLWDPSK